MSKHKLPLERVADIVSVALHLAESQGLHNVTRGGIAKKAGVSEALVSYHFGTMPQLKRKLIREAIARPNLRVLAQALAMHDSHAMRAPDELKKRALATIS